MMNFKSRIKSIQRILEIGEYTNVATECVKLIEQALQQVLSRYLERVESRRTGPAQSPGSGAEKRPKERGDSGLDNGTIRPCLS